MGDGYDLSGMGATVEYRAVEVRPSFPVMDHRGRPLCLEKQFEWTAGTLRSMVPGDVFGL